MFNKKCLSLAVAAAATGLSLSAMGAINVTTQAGKIAIANETVTPTTTGILPVGGGNTTGALDVNGQLGVGVTASDQVFVRIDWSSAVLNAAFAASSVSIGTVGASTVTDGLAGDSSAIFGVTALTPGFTQTAGVTLLQGTAGISLSGSSTDIRMRVFESQTNAINETLALSDATATSAVTLGDSLSTVYNANDAIAEVTRNYTQFNNLGTFGTVGTLGTFTASASTNFVVAASLAQVTTLSQVISLTGSVVTYTGDFAFATSVATAYAIGAGSCTAGLTPVTVDTTSFAAATSTVAAANANPLCVTVNGTTELIPETTYDISVNEVHVVTTSVPNSTVSQGTAGDIIRNGTNVEVAYLTTFVDYNQRLLLNSRHSVDAAYTVTFQTEAGVTATALAAASGTLPAGENLVLRAVDLVTITGGTRCSATVTVVAPDTTISVATTQVNLSDASTDTVSYN